MVGTSNEFLAHGTDLEFKRHLVGTRAVESMRLMVSRAGVGTAVSDLDGNKVQTIAQQFPASHARRQVLSSRQ